MDSSLPSESEPAKFCPAKATPCAANPSIRHRLTPGATYADPDVKPVRSKAMPVILTSDEDWERCLTAPVDEALKRWRSLPPGVLKVASSGPKEDEVQLEPVGAT